MTMIEKLRQNQFTDSDPVALSIKNHQKAVVNWKYGELVSELHYWVSIFDFEFKLQLPSYPVIRFRPLRNAYATYTWSRNELGTKDNITFNEKELYQDPALILRTLCHELLHLWQHYHGRPATSNYHNKEFQKKSEDCGLIVDKSGCMSGPPRLFHLCWRIMGFDWSQNQRNLSFGELEKGH